MSVLLKVQDLKTQFDKAHGVVKAVDGVSYELNEDEIIGMAIQYISCFPDGGLCQGKLRYQGF